jgi:putative endonuclease
VAGVVKYGGSLIFPCSPACRQAGQLVQLLMCWFAYVLRSDKNKVLYKGLTNNLKRRLFEHNSGKNHSTKANLPWKLVYFERFATRIEARNRERFFKSGSGREFLKVNIPL